MIEKQFFAGVEKMFFDEYNNKTAGRKVSAALRESLVRYKGGVSRSSVTGDCVMTKKGEEKKVLSAEVEDGCLVIRVPMEDEPYEGPSGKTLVHATTRGNQAVDVDDLGTLQIGVNAYEYKKGKKSKK